MPDDPTPDSQATVIRFPQSRIAGRGKNHPPKNLGMTKLALALDPRERRASGHWCGNCEGVWYGYLSEVECPVCGARCGVMSQT
jgi:hypothetical protein